MKRNWFVIVFSIVLFVAAFVVATAILDLKHVSIAQAERVEPRFYFTDFSQLGQFTMAYVVRDRKRPGHCLLIVAMQTNGGNAASMTSQEWWCE